MRRTYLRLFFLTALTLLVQCLAVIPGFSKGFLDDFHASQFKRNGLWYVVHMLCVPSAKLGFAFPCLSVTENPGGLSGWALLEIGPDHLLTVPTRKISGIESPDLFNPTMPNLWNAAWNARKHLKPNADGPIPRNRVAIVINSKAGRSQDQLHIHTSCVQRAVAKKIAAEAANITADWELMKLTIYGVHYRIKSLEADDLSGVNIFAELPSEITDNPAAMVKQTLIVIGATLADGKPGFYILNDYAHGRDSGHGETLLDRECSTAM